MGVIDMKQSDERSIPLCKSAIGAEEEAAVMDVLRSGWLTAGPKVAEFERMFAEYHGVKHAICMNSCTAALFLAMLGSGVKGEVLLPSFTFVASANTVVTAGATPVFVDIERNTRNIDPSDLERRITPRTEAIMAVHYAGHACDMDALGAIADKHGLLLIEDSAETIGGDWKGRKTGSFGVGCFSFFPTKNITIGEGGMLTTNDDALARKVSTLMAHGVERSTVQRETGMTPWLREAIVPGYNFRVSDVLAAIGVEQMKKLDSLNASRRRHSRRLIAALTGLPDLEMPVELDGCTHVYQMFTILVPPARRDEIVMKLRSRGVGASVHFFPPVHRHEAYLGLSSDDDLPVTCAVADSILTLPMYPEMSDEDVDYVAAAVRTAMLD